LRHWTPARLVSQRLTRVELLIRNVHGAVAAWWSLLGSSTLGRDLEHVRNAALVQLLAKRHTAIGHVLIPHHATVHDHGLKLGRCADYPVHGDAVVAVLILIPDGQGLYHMHM